MTQLFAWLMGLEKATSIESIGIAWTAPWARDHGWVVAAVCCLAAVTAIAFYSRTQTIRSRKLRVALSVCRSLLLTMLSLTLAAPVLRASGTIEQLPLIYLIVDDTASLKVADASSAAGGVETRADQLRHLLAPNGANLIGKLREAARCRIESYCIRGDKACRLEPIATDSLPDALLQAGLVTDLDNVLREIPRQVDAHRLAAVVLCSDFADDAAAPLESPAPVHTVGVGARELLDISIALHGEMQAKVGETTNVRIDVHQTGLTGSEATVVLATQPLFGNNAARAVESVEIARRVVSLATTSISFSIPWTPQEAGDIKLIASIEPLGAEAEVVRSNNTAERRIEVVDEALRLLYVAHEPTWEWRFIKEVFQRDKLVGHDGFRTYLAAVDSRVPAENKLFLPELATSRAKFFQHDVIFLDDVPAEMLTTEFCEQVEEFVGRFGGGLVVIAGPRFGPQQLTSTPLAQLLPVVVDANSHRQDGPDFEPRLTAEAALYSFTRLAATDVEQLAAWAHLRPLSWYQPSVAIQEQSHVLAAHPTDLCDDGRTPQPLLAIRPYGHGQVVYLATNETWRWRRRFGERYHQQFWSQLIYRLALSHSVGDGKRFRAELDRSEYQVGDIAMFSVSAFDSDFQPLAAVEESTKSLTPELIRETTAGHESQPLNLIAQSSGQWTTEIPLPVAGRYEVRITDPVTKIVHRRECTVADTAPELQPTPRNVDLQHRIANATGGRAYEASEVDQLVHELQLSPTLETQSREIALWHTPGWFLMVVGLMLGEWITRRMAALR